MFKITNFVTIYEEHPLVKLLQIGIFIRAYTLLNDRNQLAVFSVQNASTALIYASPSCFPDLPSPSSSHDPAEAFVEAYKLSRTTPSSLKGNNHAINMLPSSTAAWSSGLLRALCFINKMTHQRHSSSLVSTAPTHSSSTPHGIGHRTTENDIVLQSATRSSTASSRLLCISSGQDDSTQYLSTMNAIFASQRRGITIDACIIDNKNDDDKNKKDSAYMQQATHLTQGTYFKPAMPSALLQYLLGLHIVDAPSRESLKLPSAPAVDFRPSCFCHKKPTPLGFVCSVCLSIFCSDLPMCTTCGTDFDGNAGTKSIDI